jgi:hypothetical protein
MAGREPSDFHGRAHASLPLEIGDREAQSTQVLITQPDREIGPSPQPRWMHRAPGP